jgi:hypothetical protein
MQVTYSGTDTAIKTLAAKFFFLSLRNPYLKNEK